jgi:hypothetical protein
MVPASRYGRDARGVHQEEGGCLAQLKDLDEKSKKMLELLENDEVIGALRSDKLANMQYLKENFDVTPEMVDSLYDFGQCQYSCGSYATAADLLYQFRILVCFCLPPMFRVWDNWLTG